MLIEYKAWDGGVKGYRGSGVVGGQAIKSQIYYVKLRYIL